jgi:tetrahydromethanopterin S-methyltransferase subunit A
MDATPAVAVCTLTSRQLAVHLGQVPGVVAAAPLMTANLGIEELVRSVLDRPQIRVLLVCGRDSPLFRQGQSLVALGRAGVRPGDHRIIGAQGYQPYLTGLRPADVAAFRSLVRVVDLRGVLDPAVLVPRVAALAAEYSGAAGRPELPAVVRPRFDVLRPGGRRVPVRAATKGFFVVAVDRPARAVVLRHYWDDFTSGHEMRGRRAESMVLGVIGAGLVADLGHAAYLGAELTKAESALRLGLEYEQDLPLRGRSAAAVRRMEDCQEDAVPGQLSFPEFTRLLTTVLELPHELAAEVPLGDQADVDSVLMLELAIVLEQECGLDLPEDVDLRRSSPAELYRGGVG